MQQTSITGISVILCCHNSALRLPQTLTYLAKQKIDPVLRWEIVLVDNSSSDDTKAVAYDEWNKNGSPCPMKIVDEPVKGLSYARAKGIFSAVYNLVAFCDDDNWLHENYLQHSLDIFNTDLSIGIAGGQCFPVTDGNFPGWFQQFKESYAVGQQGTQTGYVTSVRGYLWGAGMVLRRQILLNFLSNGYKSILSDRKGNKVSSGGDSEVCIWFIRSGFQLWYDERLLFYHFVPSQRLTWTYYRKLYVGIGLSQLSLALYEVHCGRNTFVKWWRYQLLQAVNNFFSCFKNVSSIKLFYSTWIAKPSGQILPLELLTSVKQVIYLFTKVLFLYKDFKTVRNLKHLYRRASTNEPPLGFSDRNESV